MVPRPSFAAVLQDAKHKDVENFIRRIHCVVQLLRRKRALAEEVSEALEKEGVNVLSLKYRHTTRWTSTYDMLVRRMHENHAAMIAMWRAHMATRTERGNEDIEAEERKLADYTGDLGYSQEDQARLEMLIKVLKAYNFLTLELEHGVQSRPAQLSVALSSFMTAEAYLNAVLDGLSESSESGMRESIVAFGKDLLKNLQELRNQMSRHVLVHDCCVIDPRHDVPLDSLRWSNRIEHRYRFQMETV